MTDNAEVACIEAAATIATLALDSKDSIGASIDADTRDAAREYLRRQWTMTDDGDGIDDNPGAYDG